MRKTRHWLMTIAALLCSVGMSAATYSDWTSTNKGQGDDYAKVYNITLNAENSDNSDNSSGTDNVVASGACGTNLTWELTDKGELTIEGTGAMSSRPWVNNYQSNIKTATIGEGVTSIGDYAFYNCNNLTSVAIPEGVQSLERCAFYGCSSLTSITIPSSLTTVGFRAFYGCTSLRTVTIRSNSKLTNIEESAFEGCSNLRSIKIPNGVTNIGEYAFCSCSSLISMTIPQSVTSVGIYAFEGCTGELSVNCDIPSVASSSSSRMFYGSKFSGIIIGDNVTNVGNYAFYGNSNLTSVTISKAVTSIGDYAFYGCSNLISVTILNNSNLKSIGIRAFNNCSKLTSITLPDGLVSLGERAFYGCSSLASINLPEGLTNIGSSAFEYCSNLASIAIPQNIIKIENNTFAECRNLRSIIFPEGLTTIGAYAFQYCTNLSSIAIPKSVTDIEGYAFHCSSLASIDIPEDSELESIGSYAFVACKFPTITLPRRVTSIGNEVFKNCNNLSDVTLHSNPMIYYSAFYSNHNLHLVLDDTNAQSFDVDNTNSYKDVTYKRTLATGKYGTIMLPFAPDAESLENFAFFALTSNNGEYLIFDEVAEPQANTPYLYTLREGKEATQITGGATTISSVIVTPEVDGWKTVGSFTNQTIMTEEDASYNYYAYTSADSQLHRVTKKLNVKPYRAYFMTDSNQPAQLAVRTHSGETTIIDAAEVEDLCPEVYHDLSGRRIDNPTKGVYIVNGKKIIL